MRPAARRLAAVACTVFVPVLVLVACGKGTPGGFPAAQRGTTAAPSSTTAPQPSNTERQGSPAPGPVTSSTRGDVRVSVTLARGQVTPAVKEVKARQVAFVVQNDEDSTRSFKVATASGTPLVSLPAIAPDGVGTLSVELVPGSYQLLSDGGASSTFKVE